MGKIYRPKRPYEANEKKTYKEILIISHPRVRNFSYTYTLGIRGGNRAWRKGFLGVLNLISLFYFGSGSSEGSGSWSVCLLGLFKLQHSYFISKHSSW